MQAAAKLSLGPAGVTPGWLRWVLAQGWWWLLGWPLRRSLRAALGGEPAPVAGPPIRPRRPKAARARRGHSPLPYPSAA